ncbi:MAG: glycosyltransferase family 39 protein [Acidimicrobiia bacterium]
MTVGAPVQPAPASPDGSGPFDGRRGRWFLAGVIATVVVGVAMRFWTTSDLWLDEALTATIAGRGLGDLVSLLEHDGAPPLYYVLLHGWMKVFGTGDLAVRSLSGVLGVAVVALCWPAGARLGGDSRVRRQWVAVTTVVVVASSAYAIRYSTENRMYMLEVALVLVGYLAIWRALEHPTFPRLTAVAAATAALLYTQYGALYLVAVVGVCLAWAAWRGQPGGPARRTLVSVVIGCCAFLPWVPTFLYQAAHTGTPWATSTLPPTGVALTFTEFSGGDHFEGDLVGLLFLVLPLLGLFGAAVSRHHIDLDLTTRPGVRWEWIAWAVTLVVGLTASYAAGSAFQGRYAAVVYPLFALTVAFGITVFGSRGVRYGLIAFIVVFSLVGGVRNGFENRTQAGDVAAAVNARAGSGDVVAFCPDQVAPSVNRLLTGDAQQGVFPGFRRPDIVDWVDYEARNQAADPRAFADELVARAGPEGTIFYVYSGGYRTLELKCEEIAQHLTTLRSAPEVLVVDDGETFEHENLLRFAPTPDP